MVIITFVLEYYRSFHKLRGDSMKEANCCSRCGQPLALIEEAWAEDKSVSWRNKDEYCPRCYLDMIEQQHY